VKPKQSSANMFLILALNSSQKQQKYYNPHKTNSSLHVPVGPEWNIKRNSHT